MRLRNLVMDNGDFDWPRILLLALVVVTVVGVGIASAVSTAAFNPYSPTWEGSAEFREMVEADETDLEVIQHPSAYDRLEGDATAFVIAPTALPEDDYDAISSFVDRGGTVIVLDTRVDHANSLLAAVGAEARIDGQLLQDDEHYFRGPLMPVATNVSDELAGVDQVTLNYASAVVPGGADVLVTTSPYAYLGGEEDEIDDDTELDRYPVATSESVANGTVIAVSDPSVTINAMIDEPDNRAFLSALIGDSSTVALDMTHGQSVPPTQQALLIVRDSPLVQVVLGLGLVTAVALAGAGVLTRGREPDEPALAVDLTDEERVAHLRSAYPDMDDDRLQRLIAGVNRDGSKRGDDER